MARPRPAPLPPSGAVCPDCGHHFVLHRRHRSHTPPPRKIDHPDPTVLGCCAAGHGTGTSDPPCTCTRYRHTIEEPHLEAHPAWR